MVHATVAKCIGKVSLMMFCKIFAKVWELVLPALSARSIDISDNICKYR